MTGMAVEAEFPGPLYRRCTDPDCPDAWAYRDPPAEHYHFSPGRPTGSSPGDEPEPAV